MLCIPVQLKLQDIIENDNDTEDDDDGEIRRKKLKAEITIINKTLDLQTQKQCSLIMFQDSNSVILPIADEMTRCAICMQDLCSQIYLCGQGLHHFCSSCINQLPCRATYKNDFNIIPSPSHTQENKRSEFTDLIQSLHTTSGYFSAFPYHQHHPIPPAEIVKKRKYESQQQPFGCPLCVTNSVVTRVRWLEQALYPYTKKCSHYGCQERSLVSHIEEHESSCIHRPFGCPWCEEEINSFVPQQIQHHLLHSHHIPFTSLMSNKKFDLSLLQDEGDLVIYHTTFYSHTINKNRELYMLLRLQTRSDDDHRIIGIMGLDLTERHIKQPPGTTIVELVINLKAKNNESNNHNQQYSKQNQSYQIQFQPYVDGMTSEQLAVQCVALMPGSGLFCDTSGVDEGKEE